MGGREYIEDRSIPEPNSGCWLWLGGLNKHGYPKANKNIGGRIVDRLGHRVSYEAYKGEIPKGKQVLHHCDVRSCVNPDHLYVGTHDDNMRDIRERRRMPPQNGENNHNAKLTNADVETIRESPKLSKGFLAYAFGVLPEQIRRIRKHDRWRLS